MTGAGARRPGRPAANPVIKVEDLAWLEFEKPDVGAAEWFAAKSRTRVRTCFSRMIGQKHPNTRGLGARTPRVAAGMQGILSLRDGPR